MHQMKLSPLGRSERTQNRMVEHVRPAPEASFTEIFISERRVRRLIYWISNQIVRRRLAPAAGA